MFIAALFTIPKTKKQRKCLSIDEWIRYATYVYNRILVSHKKNEILPFSATWVDLEIILLSKISQTEKDKYNMLLNLTK